MEKTIKNTLRCAMLLLFLSILLRLPADKAMASELLKDNKNGVLTVSYDNTGNAKMKIAVMKDNKSYYYDLGEGKNSLDIPLTMGNGTYTIRICKNVTGNKYSVIQSQEFKLELENEDDVYLHPNIIVNYDMDYDAIVKAGQLTKKCKTEAEKVKAIYDYVVKNFDYDYDKVDDLQSGYIPDIKIVYKNKKGICYDISAVMASMLRSQGIRVRLVTGYTPNISEYHAWNVIYDSKKDKWYTVDATYDIGMSGAKKKPSMVKKASEYKDIRYQY
ncbi:transglutaminase-like putative cysteine protease [Anaerotaenia torta]|uniref:transglutaminase-like domain-containing protein n=1 Tax=Anaerotaenia torta TaxID=433293 RepID=UPI003D195DE8